MWFHLDVVYSVVFDTNAMFCFVFQITYLWLLNHRSVIQNYEQQLETDGMLHL